MSLRLRLLLAAAAAALLALVATDVVTYTSLRSYLYNQIDQQLQLVHPGIESALDSRPGSGRGPGGRERSRRLLRDPHADGHGHWTPSKAFSGATGKFLTIPKVPSKIQVFRSREHSTTSMPARPPVTGDSDGSGLPGKEARADGPVGPRSRRLPDDGLCRLVRACPTGSARRFSPTAAQLLLGVPLTATNATLTRLVDIELLVTAAALLLAVCLRLVAGESRPASPDRSGAGG